MYALLHEPIINIIQAPDLQVVLQSDMLNSIIILCFLGGAALLVAASVKRIPEGHVYSLRRWGNPQPRLLLPGVHLIVPLLERIAHKISLGGHTLRLDETLSDQAGKAPRSVRGAVYWQVLNPEHAEAVIEHVDDLIRRCAVQALSTGPLADTSHNAMLKQVLNEQLRQSGMLVTRVDLQLADMQPADAQLANTTDTP